MISIIVGDTLTLSELVQYTESSTFCDDSDLPIIIKVGKKFCRVTGSKIKLGGKNDFGVKDEFLVLEAKEILSKMR